MARFSKRFILILENSSIRGGNFCTFVRTTRWKARRIALFIETFSPERKKTTIECNIFGAIGFPEPLWYYGRVGGHWMLGSPTYVASSGYWTKEWVAISLTFLLISKSNKEDIVIQGQYSKCRTLPSGVRNCCQYWHKEKVDLFTFLHLKYHFVGLCWNLRACRWFWVFWGPINYRVSRV